MGPRSKRGLRFLSDAERREYMRVYMQQRRMGETAAQREKRLLRDRIQRQIRRAQESAEKRAIRLRKDRLRHQIRRAQERHQVVSAASWNQMWEQQWTLNEVTPTNEQNNASNLRTHPPETPSVLLPKERRTFVVPNHLESFMSNLSSLWKAGRLCDASISNGTADIMIHKMVLAAVCPKILTELSKTPLDKFQKVTFPSTVSKEALTAFAEYMYSGVLDLDETILAQLKIIAQRLDMKDFEQLCESHLQTPQLMSARMGSRVSNELQSAADFESAVGLRTQVTFRDDMTPIMKLIPVDGRNSDTWPSSTSDVSFPIASTTPNEKMLKVKQELADSTTNDNSRPSVKKEPVTLEGKVLSDSSAWETLDLLRDQSTQPQQGSLPHVESLVSISPLCPKMTNPNPAATSLNFSSPTTAGSSRPTAPNIIQHGNPPSSSSTSNTLASMTYSQTDNSQLNLLSSYASRTSESEAPLTTTAAAIASLTSNSESGTSQTLPIKLPSPLSFYNIT